jgi:hypothetical protein
VEGLMALFSRTSTIAFSRRASCWEILQWQRAPKARPRIFLVRSQVIKREYDTAVRRRLLDQKSRLDVTTPSGQGRQRRSPDSGTWLPAKSRRVSVQSGRGHGRGPCRRGRSRAYRVGESATFTRKPTVGSRSPASYRGRAQRPASPGRVARPGHHRSEARNLSTRALVVIREAAPYAVSSCYSRQLPA